MRTYEKARVVFIVGAVILVSAIFASFLVERPKDIGRPGTREYSVATSGLPRLIRSALATLALLLFLTAMATYYFIEKRDKSITFERDVLRLKRICRTYRYSLIISSVIFASLFIIAIAGLLTARRIGYAYVAHSKALGDLGITLVCISMLLFPWEYLKGIRTDPPPIILATKRKMVDLKQEYDLLPAKLKKTEIASLPMSWNPVASDYQRLRDRAIGELKPGFYTLSVMLLVALVKHDKHLIDLATELTKPNVPPYEFLSLTGIALWDLGCQDEGIAMLRRAVESDSSDSAMAFLAARTEDIEEKEGLSNKILSSDPNDADALRHLACAKWAKGEIDEGERLIDRLIKLDSNNVCAIEFKGNICFDRKEYREALAHYRRIKVKPRPIYLQFKICRCYYALGQTSKARNIAKKIKDNITSAYDIEIEGGVEAARELLTRILSSERRPDD